VSVQVDESARERECGRARSERSGARRTSPSARRSQTRRASSSSGKRTNRISSWTAPYARGADQKQRARGRGVRPINYPGVRVWREALSPSATPSRAGGGGEGGEKSRGEGADIAQNAATEEGICEVHLQRVSGALKQTIDEEAGGEGWRRWRGERPLVQASTRGA